MLCHGRSTRLRLAPGATLAVEGNTATFNHESGMDAGPKPPAVSCFLFFFSRVCFSLLGKWPETTRMINGCRMVTIVCSISR